MGLNIWQFFVCIGHFSRFRHNTNILDASRYIELFLTKSLEEKTEGNTLLKLLNSGSESCFHLFAYFFLSYGLILYLLQTEVLNSNLLLALNILENLKKDTFWPLKLNLISFDEISAFLT